MSKKLDFLYGKFGYEVLTPEWHLFPILFSRINSISDNGVILPPHLPKAVQLMLVQ